jgi:CheY-like chemotaxis protein
MIGRVLVVDDHELWRNHIRSALQGHPRWTIVGEAADGLDAVQKARALKPDLILLDIGLPALDGIVTARHILAADPESKILFFSEHRSPDIVGAALRIGARGYLLKSDARRLLAAMNAIGDGQRFISDGVTGEHRMFLPDARCPRCRSWLFPPKFAPDDIRVPPSADYVCVSCGFAYAFKGHPPVLIVLLQRPPDDLDNGDDD